MAEIYGSVLKQKLLLYPFYRFIAENVDVVVDGNRLNIIQKRKVFRIDELPVDYMCVWYLDEPLKEKVFLLRDGVYRVNHLIGFGDPEFLRFVGSQDTSWYKSLGFERLNEVELNFDYLLLQIEHGFAPVTLRLL